MDSNSALFDFSAPKGDLLEPPSSSHPFKARGYELCPALIALVRENSFAGTKEESHTFIFARFRANLLDNRT
jgi:hypothetical protein